MFRARNGIHCTGHEALCAEIAIKLRRSANRLLFYLLLIGNSLTGGQFKTYVTKLPSALTLTLYFCFQNFSQKHGENVERDFITIRIFDGKTLAQTHVYINKYS